MSGVRTCPPIIGKAVTARLRGHSRPNPVAAPLLANEAFKCARRIGYRLFGTPADIRYTRDELARFEDGDYIDSITAEVLAQKLDARTQVPFHWLPAVPLKGRADGGYRTTIGRKIVVEVKSANEKAWSRAVGMWDDVPPGPKPEWVIQAGLAACSPTIRADAVHIVAVDNERYETAEWLLELDDPLDLPDLAGRTGTETVRSLTAAEVDRQALILTCCEGGTLPPRDVPGYGIVTEPPARDEYGDPWQCKFCPYQPSCSKAGAGPVADYGEVVA